MEETCVLKQGQWNKQANITTLGQTSSDVECFKIVRRLIPSANAASQDSKGFCFAEHNADKKVDHSSNPHYRTCYYFEESTNEGKKSIQIYTIYKFKFD